MNFTGSKKQRDSASASTFFASNYSTHGHSDPHQPVTPPPNTPVECSGCKLPITDRFLLKSLERFWHEDCLKCSSCQCRLAELGSTLFSKENLVLCRRDYLRLFGSPGYCSICEKSIPAFEMVMKAKHNVYHLECFACQQCNHRFCVGDRYYLCDNKIFCEYDYEERLIFAKMSLNYESLKTIGQDNNFNTPEEFHASNLNS